MSIVFDQVDGTVQKATDDTAPADGAGSAGGSPAATQRQAAEQFEEIHRRMEWLNRRLRAD